jgi:hypothetical protein
MTAKMLPIARAIDAKAGPETENDWRAVGHEAWRKLQAIIRRKRGARAA